MKKRVSAASSAAKERNEVVVRTSKLAEYDLRPPVGIQLRLATADEFLAAWGGREGEAAFHVGVLGSLSALPPSKLRAGYEAEDLWVAWLLEAGPKHLVGSMCTLSMYNTCSLIHVTPKTSGALAEAVSLCFVPLCEAIFRLNEEEYWVRAGFVPPVSYEVEDALLAAGFELIVSDYDPHGRVTYAIRREVFAAVHG